MLIKLGITARKDNICLLHRYLLEKGVVIISERRKKIKGRGKNKKKKNKKS